MNMRLSGNDRKKLAAAIKADINAYCVSAYDEGPRSHLGASLIGEICLRKLVYANRWMHRERFSGSMLRLFNRGHKEEFRFVEWLKGIGANVRELAENGKQFRISGVHGHYGGSLDGKMLLPERYGLNIDFLLEMKTHNDKSFKKLEKVGVRLSKPKHWNQMCSYGEAANHSYGIYIAINKNDDDIYIEVVELDLALGKKNNGEKALNVCGATSLPPKIAANPAYEECKYCSMAGICHLGEPVDINCRSCANASPVENGEWYCERWKAQIPKDAIPAACGEWKAFS